MAAVYDWAVPFELVTPQGSLLINQYDPVADGYWMLDQSGCSSQRTPRVTRDNRAEASGEIMHAHFSAGYEMTLKLNPFKQPDVLACGADLTQMWDVLMLHVNSILGDQPVFDVFITGRLIWTPEGAANPRMLNGARAISLPDETVEGNAAAAFTLLTEFPYIWDAPETVTAISDGATVNLHNGGTAAFYPVIKVNGPSTAFTITNHSILDPNGAPLALIWDHSFTGAPSLGGGHYIEFSFYRETAYIDGNGANAKPGIDITNSDFFPLIPGDNEIEIAGADCDVLWQNAWA